MYIGNVLYFTVKYFKMQNKGLMEKLLKQGDKNKKATTKRNFPKLKFKDEEILVHTEDNPTQNGIAHYLNQRSWNNVMISINYKGEILTCFPVISLEMFNWLRVNKKSFPHNIFHRKKGSKTYSMLLPTTAVVR